MNYYETEENKIILISNVNKQIKRANRKRKSYFVL